MLERMFPKTPEDLKIALAQCFWVGLTGTRFDEPGTQEIFRLVQPGGIILFQRNVESADQVRRLNADLQKNSRIPLLLSVDQEGGTVERLHQVIGTIPPAMALSATRSKRLVRQVHLAHGRILNALGFNVNFNPVLDLALQNTDNGLGTRCFSNDPRTVIRCSREIIEAYARAGIHGCGKHFPGLGDTDRDSHLSLPVISRPWKQLEREDLLPYKKLLSLLPMIMISHGLYPEKDRKMPASLSREIVTQFLLKKWNYSGLVISDDLYMGAVTGMYNLTEASVRALMAGNHLFLICRPEEVVRVYERILARAKRNQELQHAIFRAASRILQFKLMHLQEPKESFSLKREIRSLQKYSERTAQRSVTTLSGGLLPEIPKTSMVFVPRTKWVTEGDCGLTAYLKSRDCNVIQEIYPLDLDQDDAAALAEQSRHEHNIVVVVNPAIHAGQIALIQNLLDKKRRVSVISGGFPVHNLPDGIQSSIAAYSTSAAALKAAGMALCGERKFYGKFPLEAK